MNVPNSPQKASRVATPQRSFFTKPEDHTANIPSTTLLPLSSPSSRESVGKRVSPQFSTPLRHSPLNRSSSHFSQEDDDSSYTESSTIVPSSYPKKIQTSLFEDESNVSTHNDVLDRVQTSPLPKEPSRLIERITSLGRKSLSPRGSDISTNWRNSTSPNINIQSSPKPTNPNPTQSPKHDLNNTSSPLEKSHTSSLSNRSIPASPTPVPLPSRVISHFSMETQSRPESQIQKLYEDDLERASKTPGARVPIRALRFLAREMKLRGQDSISVKYYERLLHELEQRSSEGSIIVESGETFDLNQLEFELAELYHLNLKSYRQAAICYRRIIRREEEIGRPSSSHYVASLVNLGLLYFEGHGVTTDQVRAIRMWQDAIELKPNSILALQCLAYVYYSGQGGVMRSYLRALSYAQRVVDLVLQEVATQQSGKSDEFSRNDSIMASTSTSMNRMIGADAAYLVAHIYRRGYDVQCNLIEAHRYYSLSADLSGVGGRAYVALARMYRNELAHEPDAEGFYEYYMRQAVLRGESSSGSTINDSSLRSPQN